MDSKNHDSGKEFIILIMRKMLKLSMKYLIIICTMLNFWLNTIQSSDLGPTSLTPPCSVTEEPFSPEIKHCCRVLNGMFHRNNTAMIITLMKYSLDLSSPWVTQYYQAEKERHDKLSIGDNRNLYKVWLTMTGNEILDLFSKNDFLDEHG